MGKEHLGNVLGVYGVLFALGFFYNWAVSWLQRRGYAEGYTSLLVVGGTLLTLAGVAVLDWMAALLTLGAFAASGFWMVVGSWARHAQARQNGQNAVRLGVRDGD